VNQSDGERTDLPVKGLAYKRPLDLGILLFAYVLILPVWVLVLALISIAIWLGNRGPVFYRQRRIGKDGHVFIANKFRTMVPDSDIKGPSWTVQKVSRLTRVGNVWRKTALDELPELWSILKGDMSFVGPCPLEENEQRQLEHQIPGFRRRLTVRPWLIGLA
jgi:lipopolysaccharide/colanic/teichoic acid biosynthesis glycosyltransferase